MNYLVVRIDAAHVLPAGYVNPAITRTARSLDRARRV